MEGPGKVVSIYSRMIELHLLLLSLGEVDVLFVELLEALVFSPGWVLIISGVRFGTSRFTWGIISCVRGSSSRTDGK